MASIPRRRQEIDEIVCMFEKELLPSFMDFQVHLLIHLVDEVELVGVVSCRWMFCFREVHEEIERICSSKGKTQGVYGRGVYHMNLSIMIVSTSRRSTTHKVQ
jgi:hypothetical protein